MAPCAKAKACGQPGTNSVRPRTHWRSGSIADCERHGRPPLTEQSFGRAIRRLRPAIKEAQRTIAVKSKQWVWLGIGLKSDQEGAAGWLQRTGEGVT